MLPGSFANPTHECPGCHMQVITLTLGPHPTCSQCGALLVPIKTVPRPQAAAAAALEGIILNNDLFTGGG